jgi:hypothetical protein
MGNFTLQGSPRIFSIFHINPWTFSPPSSSSEPLLLLCLLCSASSCRRCSHPPPAAAVQIAVVHLLLLPHPRVILSSSPPLFPPCCPCLRAPRLPELYSAATSPSLWRAHSEPQTSISRTHQHYTSLYIPFLRFLGQFSSTRPKLHVRPSSPPPATLGIAVGSRHQAPLVPINPRTSFPVPCSCSSTPCCPPIAAGAPLPTSAAVATFGLTVGSSLRAFPRHHDSLVSTTSTSCSSMTSSWGIYCPVLPSRRSPAFFLAAVVIASTGSP